METNYIEQRLDKIAAWTDDMTNRVRRLEVLLYDTDDQVRELTSIIKAAREQAKNEKDWWAVLTGNTEK